MIIVKDKEELEQIIESRSNNANLNDLDVSNVTNMSYLFFGSKFNGDISKWNVSNVTNMERMFENSFFRGDISKWDVSNVTSMFGMFYNSSFNQDISHWDVSKVQDMSFMFYKSKISEKNLNNIIMRWKVNANVNFSHFYKGINTYQDFIKKQKQLKKQKLGKFGKLLDIAD